MGRLLVVSLVGAVVLASGPAEAGRTAKAQFIAGVKGSANARTLDVFFNEVVNYELLCVRVCTEDRRTSVGRDWLKAERRLFVEVQRAADGIERLDPPLEITKLHTEWVSAMRGCAASLKYLESSLDSFLNLDAFQRKVAQALDKACFRRFGRIIPALNERGYVFA